MRAITDVVKTFEMPGTGIPGFQRKAVEMAVAGIYDIRQHRDDVVAPVLRFWKVFEIEGLSAEGEQARTELAEFMDEPREAGAALRGQARRAQGPDGAALTAAGPASRQVPAPGVHREQHVPPADGAARGRSATLPARLRGGGTGPGRTVAATPDVRGPTGQLAGWAA